MVYTVNVNSASGTPTGTVTIKSGSTTLCTITLHNGREILHQRFHDDAGRSAVHHSRLLR